MSDNVYDTTDQEIIIFLITQKAVITKTKKNDKGRTVFSFNRSDIQPYLDRWISGETITLDIHEYFRASKIFNMRVHNEC